MHVASHRPARTRAAAVPGPASAAHRRSPRSLTKLSPCTPVVLLALLLGTAAPARAQTLETLALRGHPQRLHVYGEAGGAPVIVSSGDGGWIHLGPHVAAVLATRGYRVIGFDVRAYLSSFTQAQRTLAPADVAGDYRTLVAYARGATSRPVLLVGVSEGAGLSVLAATDADLRAALAGIIALGLPDWNELAWRWRDALTYLTHRSPDEPGFSSRSVVAGIAPLPLAAIHSTHDEYVPLAEVQGVLAAAGDPKRLWLVEAADHRFSNAATALGQALDDALAWIQQHPTATP